MFEVEVRGAILGNFEDTLNKFKELNDSEFVKVKKRFSMFYFRDGDVKDVSELKNEKVDLRVRITNGEAEFVMKYGSWGGTDSRKEIEIPIGLKKVPEAVEFLKYLGWDGGAMLQTKTYVFNYKGLEFALVKTKTFNYFEAEKMVEDKDNVDSTTKEIKVICKSLGLEPFTEEEFNKVANGFNDAPGAKFDLKEQKFEDIQKENAEFFE